MAFIGVLIEGEITICKDPNAAWHDIFVVKKLWRIVTCERDYLGAYGSIPRAGMSIATSTIAAGRIRA